MAEGRRRAAGPASSSRAWQAFEGTAAGPLLRSIYGKSSAPKVHVPKPATKEWTAPETFIPAGGKVDVDARESRINHAEAASVRVPVMGRTKVKHVAAIDALPIRRRLAADIDAREAAAAARADRTGPPLVRPIATETNKRRLQAINALKGGKALPEELTQPPITGNIPLGVVSGAARVNRRGRATHGGGAGGSYPPAGAVGSPGAHLTSPALREMRSMFNAISAELGEEEAAVKAAQAKLGGPQGEAASAQVAEALRRMRSKVADMSKLDGLMRDEKNRLRALARGGFPDA